MVKAGKFSKHGGLAFAFAPTAIPYGVNSPERKIWFGVINKNTGGGNTMTVNLRGATWGFEWIDYAEFHSRPHSATTAGMAVGTAVVYLNHNPTMRLPITLNANQTRCFMFLIGRTAKPRLG